MPDTERRIEILKARAATRREKAANLAAARKLIAAAEADEARAAQLEIDYAKKNADKARKDLRHAKIVIGAGVLLLPAHSRASALARIIPLLIGRDQKWLCEWFAEEKIDFASSIIMDHSNVTSAPADLASATDLAGRAIGTALQRTLEGMQVGELGLVIPDVLGHASEEDRVVLDAWLAQRNSSNA